MQLGDQRPSGNVKDRRGMGMIGGGLGGGVVIALIAYFLGFDPSVLMNRPTEVTFASYSRSLLRTTHRHLN